MRKYSVELVIDGYREQIKLQARDDATATKLAKETARKWAENGEWGIDGASIHVDFLLADARGKVVTDSAVTVEIEPDHDRLIELAGGDLDCDHDWTTEGEGGCDENPGVWSTGGTGITTRSHCRRCGLRRDWDYTGLQRNPGDHDTRCPTISPRLGARSASARSASVRRP